MTGRSHRDQVRPYVTRDGSLIRELMHPDSHACINQSLAEAIVDAGMETRLHRHILSEEIYLFLTGNGTMTLGDEVFEVHAGDTVLIPPGTPHKVRNDGEVKMTILCSCSPPYSHKDTELL
jgi:mannose-6-phosphate isomerase-like protein (cupin superfamily)